MDDRININLHIEGYTLPFSIPRKDEAKYRKAEKQVKDMVNAYRSKFHPSNLAAQTVKMEQILVMVAFQFAFYALEAKEENETEPIMKKLEELSDQLERMFSDQ